MSDDREMPLAEAGEKLLNVAVVGGGTEGTEFLRLATLEKLGQFRFNILGLANLNPDSEASKLARERGVEVITTDFRELFEIPDLNVIIELTGDDAVRDEIDRVRPRHVRLIDSFGATVFWELYNAQQEIIQQRTEMRERVEAESKRISQIFDSLPDEIMVLDTDMMIRDANAAFLKNNSYTLEESRGKHCYDIRQKIRGDCLVDMEGCPAFQAMRDGEVHSRVRQFLGEGGKTRYAALVAAPLHDAAGNVVGVVESTRDITHRIKLEEELEATEVMLKRFMEMAPVAIYMKNAQGQYLEANQALADLFGQEREQILGKTDLELLERETAEAFRAGDREVLQSGEELRLDEEVQRGGKRIFLTTIKYPLLDAAGQAQAVCGISEDVTGLKEAELELERTSEYLRSVVNNSPVIIVTTDLEGNVVSFNPGAEESLGYAAEEVIGKPASQFYPDPAEREEIMRGVMRDGSVRDLRTKLLRKDGTPVLVSITLSQLKDSSGAMIGTVGISKDISRRRALMDQVMRSERLAAVGRLAAGVAHEINNPLAVIGEISGFLGELLEDDPELEDPETLAELREGLPKVIEQVDRCRTITHRLLTFSRKSEAKVEVTDVAAALEEILPFLEKEARLARVKIRRDYAERIPRVQMEEMQLQEIFINIIHNAIQAVGGTGEGGEIRIATSQREDGRVVITFEDDGPGIAEEVRDRLFDPFVTTKPTGVGTGLGLSICYGIVKRHDGAITVDSEPGRGATFHVILPPHPD